MKTYYPMKAAARYAGVSKRTIYRWMKCGLKLGKRPVCLRAVTVDSRTCIEERHLKAFLAARRRFREEQERKHEKFTVG